MSEKLDFDYDAALARIEIRDQYYGEGYGIPTSAMEEALALTAQMDSILLDPVYTGKAMAGMIDMIRAGEFHKQQAITFLHTGGSPALFAYQSLLNAL